LVPASASNPNDVTPAGPSAVLVRLRGGADPAAALRSLRRIANELTLPSNYGVTLLSVQRPAEIINYRSMGTIPAILGLGLAVGAALALGLTLLPRSAAAAVTWRCSRRSGSPGASSLPSSPGNRVSPSGSAP
jgi:hypothetical protein